MNSLHIAVYANIARNKENSLIHKIYRVLILICFCSCSVNLNKTEYTKRTVGVIAKYKNENRLFTATLFQINENQNNSKEICKIDEMLLERSHSIDGNYKKNDIYHRSTPFSFSNDQRFMIENQGNVKITLIEETDRKISYELFNQHIESGFYFLQFNKMRISPGNYVLVIQSIQNKIEREIRFDSLTKPTSNTSVTYNHKANRDVEISSIHSTENHRLSSQLFKLSKRDESSDFYKKIGISSFLQASQINQNQIDPFENYKKTIPYSPANDFRFQVSKSSKVTISLSSKTNPENSIILLNSFLDKGYYLLIFSKYAIDDGPYTFKCMLDKELFEKEIIILR